MTLWNRSKHWPIQGPVERQRHSAPPDLSEALQDALERLSEALTDSSHSIRPALDAVWEIEDLLEAQLIGEFTE